MYYEEEMIDGILHCRTKPYGEWVPCTRPHAAAVNVLAALTQEQRMQAIRYFCTGCGDHVLNSCCYGCNDD